MSNKVLNDLKEIYYCLVDENGKWRKLPVGTVYTSRCGKESIEIMKSIINIVVNSDNISDETRIYVTNKGLNIKDTNEVINDLRRRTAGHLQQNIKPLNYMNTTNKIAADNEKLESVLSSSFIRDLLYDRVPSANELRKFNNKLLSLYGSYEKSRDNLMIKIDSDKIDCNSYCNNEEFFDILESIEGYLVQRKIIVEEAINSNSEFVEYFNYLLSSKGVTDKKVIKDRERLMKFLNNQDYKTGYIEGEEEDTYQSDRVLNNTLEENVNNNIVKEITDEYIRAINKMEDVSESASEDTVVSEETEYNDDYTNENVDSAKSDEEEAFEITDDTFDGIQL